MKLVFLTSLLISVWFQSSFAGLCNETDTDEVVGYSRPAGSEWIPALPNIDYLGIGYNIFTGNPHTTSGMVDEGFRTPVFNTAVHRGERTSDNRYLVPKGASLRKCVSCSPKFFVSEMETMKAYFDSLGSSVEADFHGFEAAFSASADYRQVKEELSLANNSLVESWATCSAYCANLNLFSPPPFSVNFAQAVKALPLKTEEDDIETFNEFISMFGTHFTASVTFGSMYGERWSLTNSKKSDLFYLRGTHALEGAIFSAMIGAGQVVTPVDQKKAETFSSKATHRRVFSLGSHVAVGSADQWAREATGDWMPVKFSLKPIASLLTKAFFPCDDDIAAKRTALTAAMGIYCKRTLLQSLSLVDTCESPYISHSPAK